MDGPSISLVTKASRSLRVFRATHFEDRRVAACKVVAFTESTTDADRKMLEREVRIHSALSHANVIAFISAVVVETKRAVSTYVPGVYMLLELAAGGDLFDKIAPDVGVSDEIAHFYFSQLAAGIVSDITVLLHLSAQVYKVPPRVYLGLHTLPGCCASRPQT
jgi:serine/threonine protein kinase